MLEKAKWIWNAQVEGIDSYVEFRTNCEFNDKDSVLLRISAHTNYAVYMNGIFVDSGQYADCPHYKVFDELDISKFVQSGQNRLAIIVWYEGASTFTQAPSDPGLIFEIEKNGEIVSCSDENVLSRKSERYISGTREKITPQLGYNYHVDLRCNDEWMNSDEIADFVPCKLAENMPEELHQREIKKLLILPASPSEIVAQGSFAYLEGGHSNGEKMQRAALSFSYMQSQDSDEKILVKEEASHEGIYFIVDLGEENSGYLDFDLEVSEDCQMEVGWGEHLEDGRCRTQVGVRNFSVSAMLHRGRNVYMNPFRRLGCRYIQFFVHTNQVKVHYAGLRPTVYPLNIKKYQSGNLLRDRIYDVSQKTLIHCMHEHYEDCPWREQALYTLDSRNQMLCGYYAFGEYEFPRASLRLISRGAREDGMLPICYPSDSQLCIPSFTLFYIVQLAEYYRFSKDRETIEYCFACADGIMNAFMKQIDETGLVVNFEQEKAFWNFYEWHPHVDGAEYREKTHDMCLNALFSLVIDYFVELCEVMGINAKPYLQKKEQLNQRIVETFWDSQEKLFQLSDTSKGKQYSVLANAWGYLCGAAKGCDCTRILEIVQMNGNGDKDQSVVPCTLSMATFRYEVLLLADREFYKDMILQELDNTYLYMLTKGATTFWETIKGDKDFALAGSLCHGWSAMPIYYYETLSDISDN